jgi:minor extracellular serine protease Vpr
VKRLISLASVLLVVLLTAAAAGAGTRTESDGGTATPGIDTGSALVQLKGDPLATYEKTKPPHGKKVDFASSTVKSYRAQLNNLRNDFKQWLQQNAPAAKVTGEFDIALNAVGVKLNGVSLGTIASAPMVERAQHEAVYRPLAHEDPDLALVKALQAWAAGGNTAAAKGAGVEVAIVDSGIDVTHPCFSDGNPANDGRFTNDKVIVAEVHNNQAGSRGYTPEDLNSHGTHVAGTVACNEHTPALVHGVDIDAAPDGYEPSGVAPQAKLGNFNVFPAEDGNARSEDIVDALESAYEQGFDVANMSLGGNSSGIDDLLAMATDNLDRANMVIAVAAGNSGPGFSTIESPGKAERALTAGAYTVGHFVGAGITTQDGSGPFGGATGDFAVVTQDLTAPLGVVTGTGAAGLSQACSALPAGSLTGKIALVARGTCVFSLKIRNAQDAGAVATIVVNNVGGDPIAMGLGGIPNEPTIPAYMVSMADGTTLATKNGQNTTIPAALSYFNTTNDNIMAGFSSWGPTDVDFRVKPDAVAPGVNVLSSQPAWTCDPDGPAGPPAEGCWAFFQGTSMATPHLAGIAAVVRSQNQDWDASQVRSAIVNTATRTGTLNSTASAEQLNANIIGAGRADASNAVAAKVALDPVSLSFGALPSGSGQSTSKTITVSSLGGSVSSVAIAEQAVYNAAGTKITGSGVTYSASYANGMITVTMTAAKGATAGGHQATLIVRDTGGEIAHAVVYTLIK